MTVRYRDAAGEVFLEETRQASRIVGFDRDAPLVVADSVDVEFRWRSASEGGRARLGIAGLADFLVAVDGTPVVSGELRTGPDDDHAAAVLYPPTTVVEVPVSGGDVLVVVTFHPIQGAIPDALSLGVGLAPTERDADELIAEAAAAASAAEVAVVVVSTSSEVESEGFDRSSLSLPGRQDDLVRAVAAANPRTVVVVNAGAPVLLPWREEVPAILAMWFPGQEFGHALAGILSGEEEPGGRLPVTWPDDEASVPVAETRPVQGVLAYDEGIHVGSRAWLRAGAAPAFPFGHGLGYTTWRVDAAHAPATVSPDRPTPVSVRLTNSGQRAGKTVVQIYLERVSPSSVDRPVRWLGGFAAVSAQSGGTAEVEIAVAPRAFGHWDGGWRLEPGEYALRVGFSVTDLVTSVAVSVPSLELADEASVSATGGVTR